MGRDMKKKEMDHYQDRVTLVFRSQEFKEKFLTKLECGWRENHVELDWVKGNLVKALEVFVDLVGPIGS